MPKPKLPTTEHDLFAALMNLGSEESDELVPSRDAKAVVRKKTTPDPKPRSVQKTAGADVVGVPSREDNAALPAAKLSEDKPRPRGRPRKEVSR